MRGMINMEEEWKRGSAFEMIKESTPSFLLPNPNKALINALFG